MRGDDLAESARGRFQRELPGDRPMPLIATLADLRLREAVVLPEVDVGRRARLTKVVVDRGCRIPEGLIVGEDPELDARRFYRSDGGIVLISADMLAAL